MWAPEDRIVPLQAQMIKKIRKPNCKNKGTTYSIRLIPDRYDAPLAHSHSRELHQEESRALLRAYDKLLKLKLPFSSFDGYIQMKNVISR